MCPLPETCGTESFAYDDDLFEEPKLAKTTNLSSSAAYTTTRKWMKGKMGPSLDSGALTIFPFCRAVVRAFSIACGSMGGTFFPRSNSTVTRDVM